MLTPVPVLPALAEVLVLGFPEHLLAMPFEVFTSTFEHFSPAPLTHSFQLTPLLFQRFAPSNLGSAPDAPHLCPIVPEAPPTRNRKLR
jgi:hypothetical protein